MVTGNKSALLASNSVFGSGVRIEELYTGRFKTGDGVTPYASLAYDDEIALKGPKGDPGTTGDTGAAGGGATIPNTTNLIAGNGSGNGADSGLTPASMLTTSTGVQQTRTINGYPLSSNITLTALDIGAINIGLAAGLAIALG